jgi:hypothetical protein
MPELIPDVNDGAARREFILTTLPLILERLNENTPAAWGKMSAQHMVEHLAWAFELSIVNEPDRPTIPTQLFERAKRFIYHSKAGPHEVKNPALGDEPPPLRYENLQAAREALRREIQKFYAFLQANPTATVLHPLFGRLTPEEWERSHYKHCFHHLHQFGLLPAVGIRNA